MARIECHPDWTAAVLWARDAWQLWTLRDSDLVMEWDGGDYFLLHTARSGLEPRVLSEQEGRSLLLSSREEVGDHLATMPVPGNGNLPASCRPSLSPGKVNPGSHH